MFRSVLVANRGEIALRVFRTLSRLGIGSIAVFSDADRGAPHVAGADVAVRIGGPRASDSYLNIERILEAASATGAEAVHPGYGFLSENADFARAVVAAGLTWIGPPPPAIDAMGDKIRAKATVGAAGVPVVPGWDERDPRGLTVEEAAAAVGYPVLLKPSAGGGGKGMRMVEDPAALTAALDACRREAVAAFGDGTMLLERFVLRPRHIEVQVFTDRLGGGVHLGERECSLQRRHQKVVEEAPSPLLDTAARHRMGESALAAARACGYEGAGTVEFIVSADRPDDFFFMEMNTRLQVEHPVTEMVTGVDLVEWQLRVAAGEPLPLRQEDIRLHGHAVEARVYAEDPATGFLPSSGEVLALEEPRADHVRVDSGITAGTGVGTHYDPMLAKVVAWAPDRRGALARLDAALADSTVLGLTTNIGFLRGLLAEPDVAAGRLDTGLVERVSDDIAARRPPVTDVLVAACLHRLLALEPAGATPDPWAVPDGWRLGGAAPVVLRPRVDGTRAEVRVTGRASDAVVVVDDGDPVAARAHLEGGRLVVTAGGVVARWLWAADGERLWLGRGGHAWQVVFDAAADGRAEEGADAGGVVTSPMPGTVRVVHVAEGEPVASGQALIALEAMKIEYTVTAPCAGRLEHLAVAAGDTVAMDETLAVISPSPAGGDGAPDEEDTSP